MGEIIRKAAEKNYPFWITLFVSIALILGGAITPPPFVIDSSIFIATGEMLAFASLWVMWRAVEKGVDAKVKHGETELSIQNPDNNNTNTDTDEHNN